MTLDSIITDKKSRIRSLLAEIKTVESQMDQAFQLRNPEQAIQLLDQLVILQHEKAVQQWQLDQLQEQKGDKENE